MASLCTVAVILNLQELLAQQCYTVHFLEVNKVVTKGEFFFLARNTNLRKNPETFNGRRISRNIAIRFLTKLPEISEKNLGGVAYYFMN